MSSAIMDATALGLCCDHCGARNCTRHEQPAPKRCSRKGCAEEINDEADRCEICHQDFCDRHVYSEQSGAFVLCDSCKTQQQEIIGTTRREVEELLGKAQRGKFLTDEEFREALIELGRGI